MKVVFNIITEWMSSGGEEVRSIPHTKEDGEGQTHRRKGERQRLAGRQAASGGQEASDGGQASRFRTAELRHRERRKHRDLRPRGSDATLTLLTRTRAPGAETTSKKYEIERAKNWIGTLPQKNLPSTLVSMVTLVMILNVLKVNYLMEIYQDFVCKLC